MLKIVESRPVAFGEAIDTVIPAREMAEDMMQNGHVYCIKNIFHADAIDRLKQSVFDYYAKVPPSPKNYSGAQRADNYHSLERGVSPFQKSLHYFHSYVFDNIPAVPEPLTQPVTGFFHSMTSLYNALTGDNRALSSVHNDGTRFHSQILHYPAGGGMFSAHRHPLQPLRVSMIAGFAKRGRDFTESATGFEAPDGSIIDTSTAHDLGDILLFRVDMKHWVTPCDITQAMDNSSSKGRWSAVIGIVQ